MEERRPGVLRPVRRSVYNFYLRRSDGEWGGGGGGGVRGDEGWVGRTGSGIGGVVHGAVSGGLSRQHQCQNL